MESKGMPSERSILFVCDDWGNYKGGIASVNRCLALSLSRFKSVKVFSTLVRSVKDMSLADLEDASNRNVTLVGPQPGTPNINLTMMNDNPDQFFSHVTSIAPNVTHIIGHGPITAAAAIKFRDLFYTQSKVILFYHVIPRDVEWLNGELTYNVPSDEDMIGWAEAADVVYSVSDKIHWFYSTRFRNRAQVQIDHRLYLPLCAEQFFSIPRKQSAVDQHGLLEFGSRNGAEKWEGSDIAACSSAKVAKALENDEKCTVKNKLSLVVGGVPNDMTNKAKDVIDSFLAEQNVQHSFSDYADQKQMLNDLQNSSVCLIPCRAEPYGYQGLEALCAGIPTLIPEDSILSSLVRRLTADPEQFTVPVTNDVSAVRQDSSVWRDRVMLLLQHPTEAHDRALQLREAIRKDDKIKETNDDFVAYCLGGIKMKLEVTKVEFVRTKDEETKEIPTLRALNKFILYTLKQCWRLKHDPLTRKEDIHPVVPGIELSLNKIVNDVIDFIEQFDRRIVSVDNETASFTVFCPDAEGLGNLWAMCDRINRALYNNLVSEENRQLLDKFKLTQISTRGLIAGPDFLKYTRELSNVKQPDHS